MLRILIFVLKRMGFLYSPSERYAKAGKIMMDGMSEALEEDLGRGFLSNEETIDA